MTCQQHSSGIMAALGHDRLDCRISKVIAALNQVQITGAGNAVSACRRSSLEVCFRITQQQGMELVFKWTETPGQVNQNSFYAA
jgi:hypothetical protein